MHKEFFQKIFWYCKNSF